MQTRTVRIYFRVSKPWLAAWALWRRHMRSIDARFKRRAVRCGCEVVG